MKRAIIIITGLIIFNFQFLILNSVEAQNIIHPKISCPNDIWVNAYNGVLFYERTDISIPTPGLNLEALFYYNSSAADVNRGYGNGWSFVYDWHYEAVDDTIVLIQGDGRRDTYTPAGGGMHYTAPAGVFNNLRRLDGQLILTTPEGISYHFSDPTSKHVSHITDRNGNALHFTYSLMVSDDVPVVSQIRESIGQRVLVFEYRQDLLAKVYLQGDPQRAWTYGYDNNGNLVSVTSPMGHTVYYGYDNDNRINSFTDANGNTTSVAYGRDGQARRVTTSLSDMSIHYQSATSQTVVVDYLPDGNNQFTSYRWDSLGRVVEKSGNCCGMTMKLTYDENDNIIKSVDANGNVTQYTYDIRGNMLSMTDAKNYTEHYTYSAAYNLPLTYTDRGGHQYSYSYDDRGNRTTLTSPTTTTQYAYDSHGQVTSKTDVQGNSTSYSYDTYGNLSGVTDALGNTVSFTYNSYGQLTSKTDASGTKRYGYDADGRRTSIVDATGATTTIEYDANGNILKVKCQGVALYTMSYDALNRMKTITDATGATERYTYNAKDKIVEIKDALNNITRYGYDDRDRLVMKTDALGNSTRYTYDGTKLVTGIDFSNGRTLMFEYDSRGQVEKSSDNFGTIAQYSYDALGQIAGIVKAGKHTGSEYVYDTTTYTYDDKGRIISMRDAARQTTHYSYDNLSRVQSVQRPNNETLHYTYDALGRILSVSQGQGQHIDVTYDAVGRIATIADSKGNTTQYQYQTNTSAHTTTVGVTYPNHKTEQYTYNAFGSLVSFKDKANHYFTYAYDAAGRLITIVYPDGSTKSYSYDAAGQLVSASGGGVTVNMTYDAIGRLLSESTTGAAGNPVTSYAYDDLQRTLTVTYPSGRQVRTSYDFRNRPTSVSSTIIPQGTAFETHATYTFRADNRPETMVLRNGVTTAYRYSNKNLNAIVAGADADNPMQYLRMNYDVLGNMVSQIDSVNLALSEFYQYDAYSRLTKTEVGTPSSLTATDNSTRLYRYNYDEVGNWLSSFSYSLADPRGAVSYAANNINSYTAAGRATMQYDGNGNLTSDGVHTYQYDYDNNLVSVDNGNTVLYNYDPLGRRISKVLARNKYTLYRYAGSQMVESTTNTVNPSTNPDVLTSYVYSPETDNIIMAYRDGTRYYYHKNRLGSTTAITDVSGNIVERYSYDPFGTPHFYNAGNVETSSSAIDNSILFAGREYDSETGFYHYRARTFNPEMGRFLQQDPSGYNDGLNLYTYAYNNPMNYKDPSGLSGEDCSKPQKKKTWCDSHPTLCAFIPEASVKGCLIIGVGGCVEIKYNFDELANSLFDPDKSILDFTDGFDVDGEFDFGLRASANAGLDWEFDMPFYDGIPEDPNAWDKDMSKYYEGDNTTIELPWVNVSTGSYKGQNRVDFGAGPFSAGFNQNGKGHFGLSLGGGAGVSTGAKFD